MTGGQFTYPECINEIHVGVDAWNGIMGLKFG